METLIKALGPAFAAGFAVQRLLEIADPILAGRITDQNTKKKWLGSVALVFGFALAYAAQLRVLAPLGADLGRLGENMAYFVDYLVTAFIVSAGTEGFNSIMKFLSYKKEEKKAEAVQEKTTALRELSGVGRSSARMRPSGADSAAFNDVLATSLDEFKSVEDRLETELRLSLLRIKEVRERWIESGWKGRAFGDYFNHLDAFKEAVDEATMNVATQVGVTVPGGVRVKLQKEVALDTTPTVILLHMRDAIG